MTLLKINFMFKYIFYTALFLIIATTTQCNKTNVDPDGLPPETQTGAGTFACKINGVVWQWKDPDYQFLDTRPKTRWSFDNSSYGGTLYIGGFRYSDGKNSDSFLTITADSINFRKVALVALKIGDFSCDFDDFNSKSTMCNQFSTNPSYDRTTTFKSSGTLVVTKFDQSSKILSGTFHATIKQTDCDTLKITDGRFDIKYQ